MNVKSYSHEKCIIAIKKFILTIEKEFWTSVEFQFFLCERLLFVIVDRRFMHK